MNQLAEESLRYRDIIMGDFYEDFYNNSMKLEVLFEWSWKYCDFKYLVKVDDDNFIHMPNLFTFIKTFGDKPKGVYAGRAYPEIDTNRGWKYSFTYDEYPSPKLPVFVTGGAVLFSRDVVGGAIAHFFEPQLKLEDVYVGFLILNLGVGTHYSDLFQHSAGECKYDDAAISLHFWTRNKINEMDCMKICFNSMVSKHNQTAFVKSHYKEGISL